MDYNLLKNRIAGMIMGIYLGDAIFLSNKLNTNKYNKEKQYTKFFNNTSYNKDLIILKDGHVSNISILITYLLKKILKNKTNISIKKFEDKNKLKIINPLCIYLYIINILPYIFYFDSDKFFDVLNDLKFKNDENYNRLDFSFNIFYIFTLVFQNASSDNILELIPSFIQNKTLSEHITKFLNYNNVLETDIYYANNLIYHDNITLFYISIILNFKSFNDLINWLFKSNKNLKYETVILICAFYGAFLSYDNLLENNFDDIQQLLQIAQESDLTKKYMNNFDELINDLTLFYVENVNNA